MRATAGPVTITYQTGTSGTESIDCELLVIACDPRPLFGMANGGAQVLVPTPTEKAVFAPLTDYIFQTTLVSVDVPTDPAKRPKYGAILDPATARQMKGDIGAFRNESAKQYGLDVANTLPQNHLVVYQLWGPESEEDPKTAKPPTSAQLLQRLEDQLDDLTKVPWWPYETYTIDPAQPPLHTRYLHHYAPEQLEQGLPWKLLEVQGDNRTLYTWAGTCFESVLQCWQYQDLLLSPDRTNPVQLPAALEAPIVISRDGHDRDRRPHGKVHPPSGRRVGRVHRPSMPAEDGRRGDRRPRREGDRARRDRPPARSVRRGRARVDRLVAADAASNRHRPTRCRG